MLKGLSGEVGNAASDENVRLEPSVLLRVANVSNVL